MNLNNKTTQRMLPISLGLIITLALYPFIPAMCNTLHKAIQLHPGLLFAIVHIAAIIWHKLALYPYRTFKKQKLRQPKDYWFSFCIGFITVGLLISKTYVWLKSTR